MSDKYDTWAELLMARGYIHAVDVERVAHCLRETDHIPDTGRKVAPSKDAMELARLIDEKCHTKAAVWFDRDEATALIQSSFEAWKAKDVSESAVQLATEAQEKLNAPYGYKMWLTAEIIKVARGERK